MRRHLRSKQVRRDETCDCGVRVRAVSTAVLGAQAASLPTRRSTSTRRGRRPAPSTSGCSRRCATARWRWRSRRLRAEAGPGADGRQGGPPPPPARETWHAEPVKVFDNMYFVGMTEYSAWAITTSQGIILLDAIYDYSIEDEVTEGLKKLGLNPADIKYVIVSHGHLDHAGGAKYPAGEVRRAADHVGGRLRPARSAESAVEAEARHGGDRRHEGHARRHDADAVSHARSHRGHDLHAHPAARRQAAASWRRRGAARSSTSVRIGRGSWPTRSRPSASATSSRRPAPT